MEPMIVLENVVKNLKIILLCVGFLFHLKKGKFTELLGEMDLVKR